MESESSSGTTELEVSNVEIKPESLQLFQQYAKLNGTRLCDQISTEAGWKEYIMKKVKEVGDKALQVYSYRCIKRGVFAGSRLKMHPCYAKHVLPIIKEARIIDIGCCFGTDIRQLIVDGAKIPHITAVDQFSEFWELGLKLFEDIDNVEKSPLRKCFLAGNIFADEFVDKLKAFVGSKQDGCELFDIVSMGSVLHLLTEEQIQTTLQLVYKILKPGGIYIGQTAANDEPKWITREVNSSTQTGLRYLHSPSSLSELMTKYGFANVEMHMIKNYSLSQQEDGTRFGFLSFFGQKT